MCGMSLGMIFEKNFRTGPARQGGRRSPTRDLPSGDGNPSGWEGGHGEERRSIPEGPLRAPGQERGSLNGQGQGRLKVVRLSIEDRTAATAKRKINFHANGTHESVQVERKCPPRALALKEIVKK
jgi:hypothetical protein